MIIYKITNKINGKMYIGQTIQSLNKRWTNHCNCNNMAIGKAIQKYGRKNFTIKIIDTAESLEELNSKEIKWISKLDTFCNGYNFTYGGKSNSIHSEETLEKIRKTMIGKKHTKETKRKMSLTKLK